MGGLGFRRQRECLLCVSEPASIPGRQYYLLHDENVVFGVLGSSSCCSFALKGCKVVELAQGCG